MKRSGLKNRQKPIQRKTPLKAKTPLRAKKWWRPKRKKKRSDYVTEVWVLTFQNIGPMPTYPTKDGTRWTIDHFIPITFGESHGIPETKIGSKENVRWISHQENMAKGQRVYLDEQYALAASWGFPIERPSDLTRTMEGK